jgi:hypothetical protein
MAKYTKKLRKWKVSIYVTDTGVDHVGNNIRALTLKQIEAAVVSKLDLPSGVEYIRVFTEEL